MLIILRSILLKYSGIKGIQKILSEKKKIEVKKEFREYFQTSLLIFKLHNVYLNFIFFLYE